MRLELLHVHAEALCGERVTSRVFLLLHISIYLYGVASLSCLILKVQMWLVPHVPMQ